MGGGHHIPPAQRRDAPGTEEGASRIEVWSTAVGRRPGAASPAARSARTHQGGSDTEGVRGQVHGRRNGKSPEAERPSGETDDSQGASDPAPGTTTAGSDLQRTGAGTQGAPA